MGVRAAPPICAAAEELPVFSQPAQNWLLWTSNGVSSLTVTFKLSSLVVKSKNISVDLVLVAELALRFAQVAALPLG